MKKTNRKLGINVWIPIVLIFLFQLLISGSKAFSQTCNLPAPNHLIADQVTSCSVSFHWDKVNGARGYLVRYRMTASSAWKGNWKISGYTYSFSGLNANQSYDLAVSPICTNNKSGSAAIISFTTSSCTLPSSIIKNQVSDNQEQITATGICSFDTLYCRYGVNPDDLSSLEFSLTSQITLSNLQPSIKYFFQVSTCPLSINNFTATDSFVCGISPRPNIILILLDDARYDSYSCNGGPSFMQTPNIDRIANEGINFKNMFCVHSECAPSRASIATGVYPSRHGVIDNFAQRNLNSDLPLLPDILHQNGYYTALIGKNHAVFKYGNGAYFDYWLEFKSHEDGYNRSYAYFKQTKKIPGYSTDVLTDSAIKVIQRAQQPFFIWLAYHAPHDPLVPANEYDHTFESEQMPLGIDSTGYTQNYPSFIDILQNMKCPPPEADTRLRQTFEMLLSVEDGVGKILHILDSLGQLDNTMIIFTSDNGHLLGEHQLDTKRVAYEPSIRLPLFIRYPAWFTSNVVDSNFALNIDLAPTILQAAGIDSDFNMDGISLKKFYDGISTRDTLYYHYWYSLEGPWVKLPSIRAVRDRHYIFISYGCGADTTEEFFDLKNDPFQLINQINNSAFSPLITNYRLLLHQEEIQYGDTATETQLNCNLANEVFNREENRVIAKGFVCYPNPSSDVCSIQNISDHDLDIIEMNELGQVINCFHLAATDQVQLNNLSKGVHFIQGTSEGYSETIRLVVQ